MTFSRPSIRDRQTKGSPVFVRSPAWTVQRKCACGGTSKCEECEKKVQRSSVGPGSANSAPPAVHDALRSSGRPLDTSARSFMESRFGHDFSQVRVHADARAAQSAEAVGASAFTVGHHVVFGAGQYVPHSAAGRRLLAHELAHVIQQKDAGSAGALRVSDPSDAAEREADVASDHVLAGVGDASSILGRHDLEVQRQPAPTGGSGAQAAGSAATPAPTATPQPPPARKPDLEKITLNRQPKLPMFDAELDRRPAARKEPCQLTISTKLLFVPSKGWPAGEFEKWQKEFIRVVTKRWSFRYILTPSAPCKDEPCKETTAMVQVIPVTSNPYYTVNVDRFKPEGVASAVDTDTHTAQLFEPDVRRPESDLRKSHATVSHEFGHMLGLEHVRCPDNEPKCYGESREEKADVMGEGEIVTARDYKPFADAVSQITGCRWEAKEHEASLFGGLRTFFGTLLGVAGLVGGALLGLSSGIAAAVGLGLGLGYLGRRIGQELGEFLD